MTEIQVQDRPQKATHVNVFYFSVFFWRIWFMKFWNACANYYFYDQCSAVVE